MAAEREQLPLENRRLPQPLQILLRPLVNPLRPVGYFMASVAVLGGLVLDAVRRERANSRINTVRNT
jgi:hypothetical protein